MKIKWLYISLTFLSVSLLLGSVTFIYYDGNESIEIQKQDNTDQINKSLLFMDFVSKYRAYTGSDYLKFEDITTNYQAYIKAFEILEDAIHMSEKFQINALNKNIEELNLKFQEKITQQKYLKKLKEQEKAAWLQVETALSREIVTRMKKGQEFLPGFKKTLSKWAQSLSFFEKVKQTIDVSYVDQEKFKELQSLMGFSQWLIEMRDEKEINTFNKTSKSILELEIPKKTQEELLSLFKLHFDLLDKINRNKDRELTLMTSIKDLRSFGTLNLNQQVFPKWKNYISSKYENSISKRYKRHQKIVDTVSVIGVFIILCMLFLFLNIFPYLGKLEHKARQVASGDFEAEFSGKIPNNEIGNVMKAFNNMSLEISKHIIELNKKESERIQLTDSISRIRKISEMGEFSAKMAHELKNPISILTFCLTDAIELLEIGEVTKCKLELDKSIQALSRLKITANKLGAKSSISPQEEIDLTILLPEIEAMYKALIQKQGLTFKVKTKEKNLKIIAPRLEILGAISNLIDNAIEHLKMNKEADKLITLNMSKDKGSAIIEVINSGLGIENPDLIFNNFYSTKKGNIRGLGLVIVKDVVESAGGQMSYVYKENKNIFTIKLPTT